MNAASIGLIVIAALFVMVMIFTVLSLAASRNGKAEKGNKVPK